MNYVTVVEDEKRPLKKLTLKYNAQKLAHLCDEIGEGRRRRFNKLVVAGGIAVKNGWRGNLKHLDTFRSRSDHVNPKDSIVLGYFEPRTGQIKLYPETHLEIAFQQQRTINQRFDINSYQQTMDTMHLNFYQTLIEEIEHGYQEPHRSQYMSLVSKFVALTIPMLMLAVLIAVIYIVFMGLSYWWVLLVFGLMMSWIFLPVWLSLIPTPRWWQRLRYRFNQRENDAKGKAVSVKYIRMSRVAIWFEPKRSRINSLF